VCGGKTWGHIVLALCDTVTGDWGALGMSRQKGLRGAPLKHARLSRVVDAFVSEYAGIYHDVRYVRVGLPVPHDMSSSAPVVWKHTTFDPRRPDWLSSIDTHVRLLLTGGAVPPPDRSAVRALSHSPVRRRRLSMSPAPADDRPERL